MTRNTPLHFLSTKRVWLPVTFFVISLAGILHHEVWLDEAQHFLLARDSNSFTQLFGNARREGHPLLWDGLLFLLTRCTDNVLYMQLLHILLNCAAVYLIAIGNLRWYEKILLAFSYFIFYEYNFISRNYGICVLFFFLLIRQFQKNKEALCGMAILLFLLSNCHLFAMLLSAAFVLAYTSCELRLLHDLGWRKWLPALAILLAGWAIALFCIIPPHHYGQTFLGFEQSGYLSDARLIKTFSVALKGIFYVPDYTAAGHRVENSLYVQTMHIRTLWMYVLSVSALVLPAVLLWKNRFARLLYIFFVLIFLPVYYFLPLENGERYFGFLFLAYAGCYQLAREKAGKATVIMTAIVLCLQCFNGIYFAVLDYRYPFSESREVSAFVKSAGKAGEPVLIDDPTLRPGISAYTDKKYFGMETGDSLSFCLWNEHQPEGTLNARLRDILQAHSSVIIVSHNDPGNYFDTARLDKLADFQKGMLPGENASVYGYTRNASVTH